MFHLFRKTPSGVLSDKIKTTFGFETKKEQMDRDLREYRIEDVNKANHLIAKRNILISNIQVKIDYYKRIEKSYNEFIKLYDEIKELAINDITKPSSNINIPLKDKNNRLIANANYYALNMMIMTPKYASDIVFNIKALETLKNTYVLLYIDKIVGGKGQAVMDGVLVEAVDIYHHYLLVKQLLDIGAITDLSSNPYNPRLYGISLLEDIYKFIKDKKGQLNLFLNKLTYDVGVLQDSNASDERVIEAIEDAKALVMASNEYIAAQASDEYLKKYGRK